MTKLTEIQREMLTEEERGLVDQGYRSDPVFFFARRLVEAQAEIANLKEDLAQVMGN